MRQRRTALKRRNHLGTHKCQNPISAPLVQDKSYTVRRGLHMFPWPSSGSHYGNERGQITWYRSLGKAGTKSQCCVLWMGRLNKRGLKPAQSSLQTSNELSQQGGQAENFITSHLCHLVSTNYSVLLFCGSEIKALSLLFHMGTRHTEVQQNGILFYHVSPRYQNLSIVERLRTLSKYPPSHNYCRRLWRKTICLCFPVS